MAKLLAMLDLPPIWLIGCLTLAGFVDRLLPLSGLGSVGRWAGAGAGLIGVGLGVMIAAVATMVAWKTTVVPRRDPSALVTGGVFRFSRNPIYLGDAMILCGAILWWDTLWALPLVPIFVVVIQSRFILGEEARLSAGFGAEFDAYKARTRRWI